MSTAPVAPIATVTEFAVEFPGTKLTADVAGREAPPGNTVR